MRHKRFNTKIFFFSSSSLVQDQSGNMAILLALLTSAAAVASLIFGYEQNINTQKLEVTLDRERRAQEYVEEITWELEQNCARYSLSTVNAQDINQDGVGDGELSVGVSNDNVSNNEAGGPRDEILALLNTHVTVDAPFQISSFTIESEPSNPSSLALTPAGYGDLKINFTLSYDTPFGTRQKLGKASFAIMQDQALTPNVRSCATQGSMVALNMVWSSACAIEERLHECTLGTFYNAINVMMCTSFGVFSNSEVAPCNFDCLDDDGNPDPTEKDGQCAYRYFSGGIVPNSNFRHVLPPGGQVGIEKSLELISAITAENQ